jgi:Flp pilus assembly pilin Flp
MGLHATEGRNRGLSVGRSGARQAQRRTRNTGRARGTQVAQEVEQVEASLLEPASYPPAAILNCSGDIMNTETKTAATNGKKRSLLRDQRGAGLVEYAMLAGLVAIAAFAAFRTFGGNVNAAVGAQAATVQGIPTAP